MDQSVLAGRTILVVEDEWLIACDLAGILRAEGATALIAGDINEAMQLARTQPVSAALVDVNLRGGDCAPVCSAYVDAPTVKVWQNVPTLHKPVRDQDLIATITALIL